MAYSKFLVDNTTCSRRFHLTFDDEAVNVPRVEVRCRFCQAVVFAADSHPPVTLAREENLVKTSALSDNLTSECHFQDTLTQRTLPKAATTSAATGVHSANQVAPAVPVLAKPNSTP